MDVAVAFLAKFDSMGGGSNKLAPSGFIGLIMNLLNEIELLGKIVLPHQKKKK